MARSDAPGGESVLIEQIMPAVVLETSVVRIEFFAACLRAGIGPARAQMLFDVAPPELLDLGCFLDRVSITWRYEFGEPHRVGDQLVWGVHTWPLLDRLCLVLDAAERLLTRAQRREFWTRLLDPGKHGDVLAEFLPVLRAGAAVPLGHEAPTGIGNHTADWEFAVEQRKMLTDVKCRIYDGLQLVERIESGERDPDGTAPAPTHDHRGLFRSVESKFPAAESADVLQGVWIVSEVTQEREGFEAAFHRLDPRRVHYAILGSWESALHIVARHAEDQALLASAFHGAGATSPIFARG
jgi:hypothetical protein